jgi:hypothetical protein
MAELEIAHVRLNRSPLSPRGKDGKGYLADVYSDTPIASLISRGETSVPAATRCSRILIFVPCSVARPTCSQSIVRASIWPTPDTGSVERSTSTRTAPPRGRGGGRRRQRDPATYLSGLARKFAHVCGVRARLLLRGKQARVRRRPRRQRVVPVGRRGAISETLARRTRSTSGRGGGRRAGGQRSGDAYVRNVARISATRRELEQEPTSGVCVEPLYTRESRPRACRRSSASRWPPSVATTTPPTHPARRRPRRHTGRAHRRWRRVRRASPPRRSAARRRQAQHARRDPGQARPPDRRRAPRHEDAHHQRRRDRGRQRLPGPRPRRADPRLPATSAGTAAAIRPASAARRPPSPAGSWPSPTSSTHPRPFNQPGPFRRP